MGTRLKVGLFVIFGLGLTMLAIFLIGDVTHIWEPKIGYRSAFRDVGGLKPGAPVRMGGMDIGTVTWVGYQRSNLGETRIFVNLAIVRDEAPRIRTDSVATVGAKGLLGDKMIELSVGSPNAPQLDRTALIPSQEPADIFSAARKVAAATQEAIEQLQPLAKALGDPKLAEDLKGTVSDLHSLLGAVVTGDGTMHRLFYEHQAADQIDELMTHLNRSSARLDGALADIEDVTNHIKQGPGVAHALIYDGEISSNVAGSLAEINLDLRAIRQGNGLAHELLYGDSSSAHVMSNLNVMSEDLRAIVGDIRQGKGTIGALLVDPTVYEDLKAVIGNVERNEVLRSLVRYSIKADEKRKPPDVGDLHK
jgi:phospholipid/cholesterol/gamma-HCH transport system substrate-binding protein